MIEAGSQVTDKGWQAAILQDLKNTLVTKPWSRELFLRGSLAHGLADGESDVDLVVAILEQEFDSAVKELVFTLPQSLPGKLPPWFDTIVRDFGGVGLVYLLQIDEHKWGELDVYALPANRRQQFVDNDRARSLWKRCSSADCGDAKPPNVDNTRRYYSHLASCDPQQAVLACYLTIFLLRKRLLRRDRFQTFSDTYAAALSVRDLIVRTCYPGRPEHGWYGLEKVVESAVSIRAI